MFEIRLYQVSHRFFTVAGRSLGGRGLGIRKQGARTALHDPFEEGALVLDSPAELCAHEQLKLNM